MGINCEEGGYNPTSSQIIENQKEKGEQGEGEDNRGIITDSHSTPSNIQDPHLDAAISSSAKHSFYKDLGKSKPQVRTFQHHQGRKILKTVGEEFLIKFFENNLEWKPIKPA